MKKLNKHIETEKRGRYTDIFLVHDQMDSFGKIKPIKELFDSVLPYRLEEVLDQAQPFLGTYYD